jgi:2-iminobutanoate/2-iminopropanoate deaminase
MAEPQFLIALFEERHMQRTIVKTEQAPNAVGPYSQGIQTESLVFTAGQVPLDPATGKLIEGDIGEQTRRVLTSVKAILEAGGAGLDSVVKTTVYLADIGDFAAMNKVYAEFFGESLPARTTIQAVLPLGARVEIEAVALRK